MEQRHTEHFHELEFDKDGVRVLVLQVLDAKTEQYWLRGAEV